MIIYGLWTKHQQRFINFFSFFIVCKTQRELEPVSEEKTSREIFNKFNIVFYGFILKCKFDTKKMTQKYISTIERCTGNTKVKIIT